jgi:L,D-peptidoglycan transpeptidase YkuD (ErfK/YbiS/YcfS/YnhG family)
MSGVSVLAVLAAAVAAACPPGPSAQLVSVDVPGPKSTHATTRLYRRGADGCWKAVAGPWPARVGRSGVSANRHEGDGTTPLGTFGFAPTMYGTAPNPGVRFRYHRLVCGDWWNEDASTATYNSFQHVRCGSSPPFRAKSEGMWQQPTAYRHLAVVAYNMSPAVPGRGSGIFLHVSTGGPTNGCISLARANLVRVLRWLDPAAHPRIRIRIAA